MEVVLASERFGEASGKKIRVTDPAEGNGTMQKR